MASTFINIPDSGSPSWKDPVANAGSLPLNGNSNGDTRVTLDTDAIYVWNGTAWIEVATPASASNAITGLIGDVSASGPGSVPATVNFVGGVSAANVASGATAANAATSSNTPNTIVKRDGSGDFSTQQITLGANPTINLQTATKQYVDNFPAINGLQNTGYSLSPVYGSTANTITEGNDARLSTTNLVKVKQNPGAGEFSSVNAALASITTNSPTNPFEILIGPGVYTESQITLKPYVSLTGYTQQATILVPSNNNQAFIIGADFSTVARLTIFGATGLSGIGIQYTSSSDSSEFLVKDCVFGNNTTLLYANGNSSHETIVQVQNCVTIPDVIFTDGFKVDASGGVRSRLVLSGLFLNTGHSSSNPEDFIECNGDGSKVLLSDSFFIGPFASPAGNALHLFNGADVTVVGSNFINMDKCIWVENSGIASNIAITGVHTDSNNNDIVIQQTTATGSIEGSFEAANSIINSSLVSVFFTDPTDGITFTGDLAFGPDFNSRTDVTDLILQGPTMGLYSGGDLSNGGGFVVDVASGTGYFSIGIPAKFFTWSATSITLTASTSNYIYFTSGGTLTANSNFPNTENNILLGRVVTNSTGIEFIDDSPLDASNYGNLNDNFIREALGPVFAFGCIVSENATVKHLDVTSGSYYFGNNNFLPSAGTNITFQTFFQNGSGGWTIGSSNVVDVNHYDNSSGTLANIPTSNFARHTLYIIGQGSNQKYLFVYSQATYSTLVAAQTGNIPTPPSYFTDGVVLIASIIVQQGSTSIIPNGQIVDNRPRIGFALPAVEAVGTVTSVALSLPGTVFSVSGSPVTSTGTLTGTFTNQTANTFFTGPTSGGANSPTFRSIVPGDVPTLNQNTTGTAANITATSNSTLTTLSALSLPGAQVTGNISGNAGNIIATSNSTLVTLSALSLPGAQVTGNISGNAANITATSNSTLTSLPSLVLPTSQLSGTISLTTQVSGILPSTNGGTGVNNAFNLTIGGTSSINGTVTGTNTGDITLIAVGSSPNANAASLSGQVLNLQPADGTHPGVVSTTTQTFAGNKTFSGTLTSTSLTINGTGGAGFIQYNTQSAAPSIPATGYSQYADSTNRFSWMGANGFTRTFDGTANTGNRDYTLRDVSGKLNMDTRMSYAGFSITSSPYTILSTDAFSIYFITTASVAITINLPAISTISDRAYIFKDISGDANTNNITLVPSGTDTIEGLNVNKLLQTNFGSWTLISDSIGGWWMA